MPRNRNGGHGAPVAPVDIFPVGRLRYAPLSGCADEGRVAREGATLLVEASVLARGRSGGRPLGDEAILRELLVKIGRRDAERGPAHLFCKLLIRLRAVEFRVTGVVEVASEHALFLALDGHESPSQPSYPGTGFLLSTGRVGLRFGD